MLVGATEGNSLDLLNFVDLSLTLHIDVDNRARSERMNFLTLPIVVRYRCCNTVEMGHEVECNAKLET
jgi:hypothetical protein